MYKLTSKALQSSLTTALLTQRSVSHYLFITLSFKLVYHVEYTNLTLYFFNLTLLIRFNSYCRFAFLSAVNEDSDRE